MREIKFRGKSETYKAWIYGVPYYSEGLWWILVDDNTCSEEFGTGSYCVDPETIGRYTGLTDKNGVEFYEGDIIVCYGERVPVKFGCYGEYDEYRGWYFDRVDSNCHFNHSFDDWQIIGNIHDNPELLKEDD